MNPPKYQTDYVRINRIRLLDWAWQSYKTRGRGFIHVTSDLRMDLRNAKYGFVPEGEISQCIRRDSKKRVCKMVSGYNPGTELVIVFSAADSLELDVYTVTSEMAHTDVVASEFRKMFAALRDCPTNSKTIDELERRLEEVIENSGGLLGSRDVWELAVGNALVDMKALLGLPAQLTEKTARSSSRLVNVLHKAYTMDGDAGLWNLFNVHLRPLREPQPEPAATEGGGETLAAAAAIAWASEQSRKLRKLEKQKSVRADYFQAHEIIQMIANQACLDNSEAAVEALASIAHAAAEELEKLPRKIVAPVARRHPSWPVMVSAGMTPDSKRAADIASYLKELDAGVDCPVNSGSSSKRDETRITTRHALRLLATVEYNRALGPVFANEIETQQTNSAQPLFPDWVVSASKLPPFSKVSAPQWWDVAKTALKEACAKTEEHPHFNVPGAVVAGDQNDPAIRRARIIERIRAAFVALAPN